MTIAKPKPSTYHGNRNISAFGDMSAGVDRVGMFKTLGMPADENERNRVADVIEQVMLEGADPNLLKWSVEIDHMGRIDLDAEGWTAFERQFHYLSQPSRLRESGRSSLGIRAVAERVTMYQSRESIRTIQDYCGRLGVSTSILIGIYPHLADVRVNEEYAYWNNQLANLFPNVVPTHVAPPQCFETVTEPSNVALIDYCSWIPSRDFPGMEQGFKVGHENILLTDASAFYWHLNRQSYVKGMFEAPEDHADYVRMFSDFLGDYGYHIAYSIKRHTLITHLIRRGKRRYGGIIERFGDCFRTAEAGYKLNVDLA